MSSNLVIAALPAEDDYVWKISSEKKPHCTLLFLGDADKVQNLEQIVQFVEHAVSICEHGPFMLDVDYRGVLGADEADVLFFKKKGWSTKWISEFRSSLLQEPNIKTAYDSAEQFPEWQPHLTLGYPETPAHPDEREYPGLTWVSFDRIAVWTGDYEGPEFRLEWDEDYGMAKESGYLHGVNFVNEVLAHHGVKGQKWGVRKVVSGVTTVKNRLGDKRFEDSVKKSEATHKLIKEAAKKTKQEDLPSINAKYKGMAKTNKHVVLIGVSKNPTQKAYRNEVKEAYRKRLEEVANSKVNPSKTRKYVISDISPGSKSPTRWVLRTTEVSHAVEDSFTEFEVDPVFDDEGFIVDFIPVVKSEDSMKQADDFIENYLSHHGIKGMKWGVRSAKGNVPVTPTSVKVSTTPHAKKATKVEVEGGHGHDAHTDAVKVAEARQKLRKSGPAALSNKELQDVATRLQLESNVARLEGERKSGQGFVGKLLKRHGNQQLDRGINKAAGQVTDELGSAAGKAAVARLAKKGLKVGAAAAV